MSYIVIGLIVIVVAGILLFVVGILSDLGTIKKEDKRKYRGF